MRVSRALASSCSGFAMPKSANTLPVPSVGRLFFLLIISILPFSVIAFGVCQTLPDEINLSFRSGDAFLGLLLEGVENIDCIFKTNSVNGPPRVPGKGSYDLHHASSGKSGQGLDGGIGFTTLSGKD